MTPAAESVKRQLTRREAFTDEESFYESKACEIIQASGAVDIIKALQRRIAFGESVIPSVRLKTLKFLETYGRPANDRE